MLGANLRDVEFECRKCRKVFSFEHNGLDQFCPDCGTLLRPRRQPKYWLFQFNPAMYGWFDWIKESRETEQWLTSQHARYIHEGDMVAIWSSGEKAGVYAIGEIITNPRENYLNSEQEKYWSDRANVYKFSYKNSVMVKYLKVVIDNPLLQEECSKDPILSAMQVLKNPQGTNFPLTKKQWTRILELMERKAPNK